MSENGETKRELGEIVSTILGSLEEDTSSILADMCGTYPLLRRYMLGGKPGTGSAPAASLTFRRVSGGMQCALAIAPLGVELVYPCSSFFGTLELIELELQETTAQWRPDWKRQRKERSAWDGVGL